MTSRPLGQHFTPAPTARWLVELCLEGWSALERSSRGGAFVEGNPVAYQEDAGRVGRGLASGEAAGGERGARPLVVVDPACGQGALLAAAASALGSWPGGVRLRGVELDAPVAEQARAALGPGASVVCGDALALAGRAPLADGSAELVLLNPPYIGEKGHRALFEGAAALGGRHAARLAPRMDYLYFFLHLGLDLLRPGGRMMALTTAYWPSATGASLLRADLASRARLLRWVRLGGQRLFPDAPGQHNLALILERAEDPAPAPHAWIDASVAEGGHVEVLAEHRGLDPLPPDQPWQPFVTPEAQARVRRARRDWPVKLGEVAVDRQGVVSGLDRTGARHRTLLGARLPLDAPGFVLTGAEVAARGWADDPEVRPFLEPILRGSSISRLDRRDARQAPDEPGATVLLYLDGRGPEPPEALLAHLAPLRPALERRREVREGSLPWWALHWPRDRAAMRQPKLVCARRDGAMRFCLDMAGHVVSSDCTCLWPRDGRPESLRALWLALHLPEVEALMRATGKAKGKLLELYSQPLRQLALPLVQTPDGLQPLTPTTLAPVIAEATRAGSP